MIMTKGTSFDFLVENIAMAFLFSCEKGKSLLVNIEEKQWCFGVI